MSDNERVTPEPPWFSRQPGITHNSEPGAGITTPSAGAIPSGSLPLTRQGLLDALEEMERAVRLINTQRDGLRKILDDTGRAVNITDALLAHALARRDILRSALDAGGCPQ